MGSFPADTTPNAAFEAGTDYQSVMPQFQPEGIEQNRELLHFLNTLTKEKGGHLQVTSLFQVKLHRSDNGRYQ